MIEASNKCRRDYVWGEWCQGLDGPSWNGWGWHKKGANNIQLLTIYELYWSIVGCKYSSPLTWWKSLMANFLQLQPSCGQMVILVVWAVHAWFLPMMSDFIQIYIKAKIFLWMQLWAWLNIYRKQFVWKSKLFTSKA